MRATDVDKQVLSRYLLQNPYLYRLRSRLSSTSKQMNNHFDEIAFKMNMIIESCDRMSHIPAENILIYSKRIKKIVDSNTGHWNVLWLHAANIYLITVSMFCKTLLWNLPLTLILLMWRIWWTLNNASKWQMGFNSAFKGLMLYLTSYNRHAVYYTYPKVR